MENTNYFNKNNQSHIKVKVPLPNFFTPIVPLLTSCVTPPPHNATSLSTMQNHLSNMDLINIM